MPGIFGVYDPDPVDLHTKLRSMEEKIYLTENARIKTYHSPGFSMGVVYNKEPIRISQNGQEVFIEGDIYSNEKFDLNRLKDLNGNYFGLCYNSKDHILKLFTDRFALHPHFIKIGKQTTFSFQIWPLIIGSEELDWTGITEFLLLGSVHNNRTFFEKISFIPPASLVEIDRTEVKTCCYWEPHFEFQHTFMDDVLDELSEVVAQRKEVNDGIMLSGGLDSRLLLRLAPDLIAFTYGPDNCTDVQIVKKFTRSLDFKTNFLNFDVKRFPEYALESIKITSGLCPIHSLVRIQFLRKVMKKTKRIFSGFVGDVVLGGSYTNPLLFLPKFISKGWLKKRLELTADNEFMNTRVLAEHNDHIAVYLKDDMRYAQLKYAINELIAHHLALGITLDRSFFQVLLPFVDYRLFDCLAKIRPEERILSVGYIRMLKRNFPEIASIPWARTGYRLYTSLYKLFLSRLRHRLLPKTINYVDFHRWFSGPLKNWIDDILISNGEFWLKTIGKDEIERLRKNPLVTSALLTVELTMRCLKS